MSKKVTLKKNNFSEILHFIFCSFLSSTPRWLIYLALSQEYRGLNQGLQLPIMSLSLMHIMLNSIDIDMKSEICSSRGGLRPYPLRFHVEEAGADAKLIQHGHLGVT